METIQEQKIYTLANFLECATEDVQETSYDDNTFKAEGGEYLVLTDSEADEKATEQIKESVWAFNTSFILGECGLDFSGEDSLKRMQENSCEDANDFMLSLIERTCGLSSFVSSAISADGRGHFLATYDGDENEQIVDGIDEYFYIYRAN